MTGIRPGGRAGRSTPAAVGKSEPSARVPAGGERARHRALYREIPTMRCLDGCAACCGPAPVSPWEAERLGIPGAVVTPVHPGTSRCRFHIDGACSVYERRPFICRLYGVSAVAPCERGQAPTTLIPTGRAVRMVQRFEEGCPPSWQEDRRAAVREAVEAAGDTEAIASLDGYRTALGEAEGTVRALRAGQGVGTAADVGTPTRVIGEEPGTPSDARRRTDPTRSHGARR